ncbi:MAG: hypothetical protein JW809_09440 [Pirellulales bacterium]|nr:hypothetical protein [Pirellulales bacterium]
MIVSLRNCIIIASAVVLLGTSPSAAEMMVVANFDGGGSDAAPVTDVVDAYTGMAGDGWAGPWKKATSISSMVETVLNTNPLSAGGGNYLNSVISNTGATNARGSVGRSYKYDATTNPGGWDVTKDHQVTFKFRVEESLSTFDDGVYDAFQLFDASNVLSNTGNDCRWTISVNGVSDGQGGFVPGNWYAQDWSTGSQVNIDTGILLESGVVYDFEITVRNVEGYTKQRWDLTIGNGTTSFDSTLVSGLENGMGFRSTAATVGGYVNFSARANPNGDQRNFSINSLHVVPEPSIAALGVTLALAALGMGARRRRP